MASHHTYLYNWQPSTNYYIRRAAGCYSAPGRGTQTWHLVKNDNFGPYSRTSSAVTYEHIQTSFGILVGVGPPYKAPDNHSSEMFTTWAISPLNFEKHVWTETSKVSKSEKLLIMGPEIVCSRNYFFTTYVAGYEHLLHFSGDPQFLYRGSQICKIVVFFRNWRLPVRWLFDVAKMFQSALEEYAGFS